VTAKLSVLRACHRVLKPGGKIAYYNIFISHEAPAAEQRRFAQANPSQYSRAEQTALIRSAGLVLVQEVDVTDEYRRVQRALYEANGRHAKALRRQLGEQFDERQRNRLRTLEGIESGVLRRSLFIAERSIRQR
jgi:predicted SAM-dependent methyltransferase